MNIDNLSMSHIVQNNPIVYAEEAVRKKYLSCLTKYINVSGIGKRKYTRAQLTAYKTIVNGYEEKEKKMLYSVINTDARRHLIPLIRAIDPHAFINVVKTEELAGRFHDIPND